MKSQLHSKKKKSSFKPRQAPGKTIKIVLLEINLLKRGGLELMTWFGADDSYFWTCPEMVTRTGPFLPRMERGTPRRERLWRRKMEDFGLFGAVQWQSVFCSFLERSNDNIFGTVPVGDGRDVQIDISPISLTCSCKRWCCDVQTCARASSANKQSNLRLHSLGLMWTLFVDNTLDYSVLDNTIDLVDKFHNLMLFGYIMCISFPKYYRALYNNNRSCYGQVILC